MKNYRIKITPLTGLHIGSGFEITPIEYKLSTNNAGNRKLLKFSHNKIISSLDKVKKLELLKLIDESSSNINALKKVIEFLHNNVKEEDIDYSIRVDRSFAEIYDTKFMDINNQLIVNQTYRSSKNYKPVIPGSSIKGSIRTAILNYLVNNKYAEVKRYYDFLKKERKLRADKIEKKILKFKDPKNDPLRTLIVDDCEISGNSTSFITKLEIYKRKQNKIQKQHMFYEIITGELLGGDASGITHIKIDDDLLKAPGDGGYFFRNQNLTISLIIQACNSFYKNILKCEEEKFYKNTFIPCGFDTLKEKIENEIPDNKNICLLRLGRFSQIESITFPKDLRNPRTKRGYGNTRTLALYNDTYYPIGWIKLEILES